MKTFLSTHRRYVHTDAADRPHERADAEHLRIKNRAKVSKEPTPVKVTPPTKAEPVPPSRAKTAAPSLNKLRIMVQEVEHRIIVARYNDPKPKAKALPPKCVKLRCTKCHLDFQSTDAAAAHVKLGKCAAVNKKSKWAKERSAKSPSSSLPDGFEPSSSVSTVSGGLPGLGKRSR